MKITKCEIQHLESKLNYNKKQVIILEDQIRELKQKYFRQNATRPIYNYKDFLSPNLDYSKTHETKTIWVDTGTISDMTHKNVYIWVCKFCQRPKVHKYIATGHDHTDYSYEVCDCAGAQKHGKHYKDLK